MSIVADQVRRLDGQVDRISLVPFLHVDDDVRLRELDGQGPGRSLQAFSSPRMSELLRVVKALSTTSTSQPLLSPTRLQALLRDSGLLAGVSGQGVLIQPKPSHEAEIEWLLVAKATVQTYGVVLDTLLGQITPLSDEIWYWDQVLGSYTYSSIYTLQTSPLRWWAWGKDIYHESKDRISRLRRRESETAISAENVQPSNLSLSQRWQQFYGIVRESIWDRSVSDIQRRVLSPVALCRSEARRKRAKLQRMREMTASGLGVLIDEGLSFGLDDDAKSESSQGNQEWKGVVERSVALMDMVLQGVLTLDVGVADFEDKVFAGVEEDPELSIHAEDTGSEDRPAILARRLMTLLEEGLPVHARATKGVWQEAGRPPWLVRYWLPVGVTLLSSSAVVRILVHRKDDVINWVQDLATTAQDFWFNWVIEPLQRVVRTIRHDATSEIAIMSRDSLKADRESLERMVVDFAADRPDLAGGSGPLTDAQIVDIRAKVREGDVTPVLKAYETDLRKPFMGAVRGNLVRALLIQVQKTKVDLEVAISGIDSLLKSQELVFGFVGLTPGVLVSIGALQYLRTAVGGRRGLRRGKKASRSIRVLRNIDRILSEATPSQNNLLSYKDHGLLVCEVHVLRTLMCGLGLPGDVEKEFLEDLDDLANLKGIQIQVRALDRIRWAYAKWLR